MAALPLPDSIKKQASSLKTVESFPVRRFFERFGEPLELELVAGEMGLQNRKIREKSINRPALALTGYYDYFAHKRLQLFGAGEMGYLRSLVRERQQKVLKEIVDHNIPCMVVSRGLRPTATMLDIAKEAKVPLFRTRMKSKDFSAEATILLEQELAPQTSLHGTLMDIKGVGTLLRGKSGVGKSECALALVERGHSLVADDFVSIRLVGDRELVGTGTELSRGYMECRGIGIINIGELFGVRSVRLEKRIDLVITFIDWHPGMHEERTGLERHYFEILDHKVSHVEIPVRPGRDMARLVEVAALVHALKRMGHDSAHAFNERLIAYMQEHSK
ncbi:MAG: HPr(Ser) kinase/phosphatase [Verrucomicrobia bacterium 21-51-4]|nr:MAG: HPr(Ser) kinase/phosphatase [Verrucomicrobia bacterium 21-51-4]HQU08407.1 HPr(Ser) kinase/phosphatase [Opitutales bacterium]